MTRPNVLMIHTDQQAAWTVGVHGSTVITTPNIDRIGEEGAIFDRCHTVSAVCTPSRGYLMTGRYPHQHGAYENNRMLNGDSITWAEMLRRDGYRTDYVGKWHLDGQLRPGFVHPKRGFGFDDTTYMFNRGHWKTMSDRRNFEPGISMETADAPESYTTDFLTTKAIDFIGDKREEPFALMLSIPDPHHPWRVREPYASMFNPDDLVIADSWDDSYYPAWAPTVVGERTPENVRKLQQHFASYLGMVACIDDNVGRLLDHLDAVGLSENTLVVFTSDHGEYLGEHGIEGKNQMYKSVYEIPCVLRMPGRIPAGIRCDRMITQNDFAATLCSLAGVAAPPHHCGRDFSALIDNEQAPWRDEVQQHHSSLALAGLLTCDWHLILDRAGDHHLFDLANDPDERRNRFADAAFRDRRSVLAHRVLAHHEDTGSPAADWLREVVPSL